MQLDGSHWTHEETVAAGANVVVYMPCNRPCQVTVQAGAGGGATVAVTAASQAQIEAGNAIWVTTLNVTAGASGQLGTFNAPRAMRFAATVTAARFQFCQ